MNKTVKIEIRARYGFGTHETKTIRLRPEGGSGLYLTMSERTYKKYCDLLCCAGEDYLVKADKSDYTIIVRDSNWQAVNFF